MSTAPDFESLSVESATVHVQLSAWQRVRRNTSVRIGGTVMLLLVLVSLAAPWLGTVDPSLFDPASRDLLPGKFDTDRLAATLGGAAARSGRTLEEVRLAHQASIPAGRFGSAQEFGALCAFLCSVQAGYVTGQNLLADGGAYPGA